MSIDNMSAYSKIYSKTKRLVVLLDMDGVLANYEKQLLENYRKKNPDSEFIPIKERREFYASQEYSKLNPDCRAKILAIQQAEGFFENLPAIEGAKAAVREMENIDNLDVFICTSPLDEYMYCVPEKYKWVETHLGESWVKKIIITKDKTLVNAHILIDDKPDITGVMTSNPPWEQVVFSAPYNRQLTNHTRLENWTDGTWRNVINDGFKRL